MLALLHIGTAFVAPLGPARVTTRASAVVATASVDPNEQLKRAKDLLGLEEGCSVKDIVNVLGRWTTYKQWDSVGELVQMDKLFNSDGTEIVQLKSQQTSSLLAPKKGNGDWVKKTPQRRGFCLRRGLCQRYWHSENVGKLPFKSKSLAASIGCTVSELNSMPINPLATDVIFDALSQGNSGIIQREIADERRASYETPAGFNLAAFKSDLSAGKVTCVRSYLIFPGTFQLTALGIFFKLDGLGQFQEYLDQTWSILGPAYFGIDVS